MFWSSKKWAYKAHIVNDPWLIQSSTNTLTHTNANIQDLRWSFSVMRDEESVSWVIKGIIVGWVILKVIAPRGYNYEYLQFEAFYMYASPVFQKTVVFVCLF